MNKQHVTSLELSKRLKALGVPQVSEFYWVEVWDQDKGNYWDIRQGDERGVSAFLASEILEQIPYEIERKVDYGLDFIHTNIEITSRGFLAIIQYPTESYGLPKDRKVFEHASLAVACGLMWIYLKEEGLA